MTGKPKSIIGNIGTVTYTAAFLVALLSFAVGAVTYSYVFKIQPSRPGCVQISVKNTGGQALQGAKVDIYISIYGETGEKVDDAFTDKSGKVKFCDKFEPNKEYLVRIYDQNGEQLWSGFFATNEKSTADFPIIVRQEY
jgi:hypothetical protein